MIADGQLGVAVSGGADSVALLHLLLEAGFPLTVLHVNHGLRGVESDADQEFVSQVALQLGIPFLVHRSDVPRGNVEQWARRARYRWFRELIHAGYVTQVATGHTRDDQAETVLFRFLRGSGTAGLAGVRLEVGGIVRPLLDIGRADLRRYLKNRGIAWREDPSNQELSFRRNRIRHELLPLLERNWNVNLTAALAKTAVWAQAEEDYWRAELPRLTAGWLRFDEQSATMDVAQLTALPVAAARRAIRFALEQFQGNLREVEFAHIERVRLLRMGSFCTARWTACRSGRQLRIASAGLVNERYRFDLTIPGTYAIPGQTFTLRLELKANNNVYNDEWQQVDWEQVSGSPLELRSWQPGDSFHQAGRSSVRKLKVFFQEAGIPSWERSGWPVITYNNSLVWTRGLGAAAGFLPSPATREILLIHESANQKVSK